MDGIFHNAHEVYGRANPQSEWSWVATFATERLARDYARLIGRITSGEFEVRPV